MDESPNLSQLRQSISKQFDLAELHRLCADLGLDYENLAGATKDEKVVSLAEWAQRHGRIPDLIAAVQQRHPELKTGVRVYEHGRYNLAANFVGRKKELEELDDWLADDRPMFAVIALGGTGKSALAWHWLETVKAREKPPFKLIIWHGFYETGHVDIFLTDVLEFLGEDLKQMRSKRVQLNRLLERLAAMPALIILDGAERLLRAYSGMNAAYQGDEEQTPTLGHVRECVDPVAADLLIGLSQLGNGSKTLMTTRLMPRDLLGWGGKLSARIGRRDLTGLDPEDAYRFFTEWGIQATRAEVNAVCQPLEYHPFCMALLSGYAAEDFENPGDLRAAVGYDPTHDLLGRRQHVLQRAYDNLPPDAQTTLGKLAAFRAAVPWEIIAAVFGDTPETRANLRLLEQRGLLQRAQPPATSNQQPTTTFDLHPIARRYAYERLADPTAVHAQLIDYFKAVPQPQKISGLADLAPTIELYHHLTRAERNDEARILFRDRLATPLYYQLGAYQQMIDLLRALFPDGEDKLPSLSKENDQVWTLAALANSYSLSGQPGAAIPLFQRVVSLKEKQKDKKNMAVGLYNLADEQINISALAEAAGSLRRSIALCQEIEDRPKEAIGHAEYGRLLAYCGDWVKSTTELDAAQDEFDRLGPSITNYVSVVRANRALFSLLQEDGAAARDAAHEALRLADETTRTHFPVERDYVRAHWLLGWAALVQGNYTESQTHLDETLHRCRAINLVEFEPPILLAQARLARAKGQPGRSLNYAQQALTIAQRSGYVLHLADIHNHLARLALDAGDTATARTHAQTAHDYAFCDGPPYAYQPALDEAIRLLNEL